jgi:DNA replication protein DnaC
MNDKQAIIQREIQNLLAAAGANYTPLSLEDEIIRDRRRQAEAAQKRAAERAAQREAAMWQCDFCHVIYPPRKHPHPLKPGEIVLKKVVTCDCQGFQQAQEQARRQAEAARLARHLAFLETEPLFVDFETEWPDTEQARAQLRQAKSKVYDWYRAYPQTGGGLLLAGEYGCGKSDLLRAVVRAFGRQGMAVAFYNEAQILEHVESQERKGEFTRRCGAARILVLDDIGRLDFDPYSGWKQNLLQTFYFQILERRANDQVGTLFSTNRYAADLEQRIGGAAMDRIFAVVGAPDTWIGMWQVPSRRRRHFPVR